MTTQFTYHVGIMSPRAEVIVYNRQDKVEYKVLSDYASESNIRSHVGNYGSGSYDPYYDGWYGNRKVAVERLEIEIKRTENYLEALKFSLKVTKKKVWEEIK
ncbi:hypothetical protein VP14_202 [Vibrio phage VPMCC14]|nr:hypothetical protein VP14_202 [Vibrio phage VPMCC14]